MTSWAALLVTLTWFAPAAAARDLMMPRSCDALRPSGTAGAAVLVDFQNSSSQTVVILWSNQNGSLSEYARLAPGQKYQVQTFVNHEWVLRDLAGSCLGAYQVQGTSILRYFGATPELGYGAVCSVTDGFTWHVAYSERTDIDTVCNEARFALSQLGGQPTSVVSSFFARQMNNVAWAECRRNSDGQLERTSFRGQGWLAIDEALQFTQSQRHQHSACIVRVEDITADPLFPTNLETHTSFCSIRSAQGEGISAYGGSGAWANCLTTANWVARDQVAIMNAGFLTLEDQHKAVMECTNGRVVTKIGPTKTLVADFWKETMDNPALGCTVRYRNEHDEECGEGLRPVRQGNGHMLCMPNWTSQEIFDNGATQVDRELNKFWEEFQRQRDSVDSGVRLEEIEVRKVSQDKVKATRPLTPSEQNRLARQTRQRDRANEHPAGSGLPTTRVQWNWPIGNDWFGARLNSFAQWDSAGSGQMQGRLSGYVGPFDREVVDVSGHSNCQNNKLDLMLQARVLGQTIYQTPMTERRVDAEWESKPKTWKKTFLKHKQRFTVGPVPMSVKLGVSGEAGLGKATAFARGCDGPGRRTVLWAEVPAQYRLTGFAEGGADIEVAEAGVRGNLNFMDGQVFGRLASGSPRVPPCVGIGLQELRALNGDVRLYAEVNGPARKVIKFLSQFWEAAIY